MTLKFCNFEHICSLNHNCECFWLFSTAKGIWGTLFSLQYEGSTIQIWKGYWSGFFRDTLHCYSPKMGLLMRVWIFEKVRFSLHICVNSISYPIDTQNKNQYPPNTSLNLPWSADSLCDELLVIVGGKGRRHWSRAVFHLSLSKHNYLREIEFALGEPPLTHCRYHDESHKLFWGCF
jgi:hypothetical protein